MQHDERRVQSSPTTRGTSFAARRAACELGAGERARVHLCHAVPRVTGSCGPLYLLIIIGLRTENDANNSFFTHCSHRGTRCERIYTSAQHEKRRRRCRLRRRRRRWRCWRCCCRCRSRPCRVRVASRGPRSRCVLEHTPGARAYQAKRQRGKEAKWQSGKPKRQTSQRGKDQRGKEAKIKEVKTKEAKASRQRG